MKLLRIDWLAIIFGIVFGLWMAADRYVGFYIGIPLPVGLGFIAAVLCLVGVVAIGLRDWRSALLSLVVGLALVGLMDRVWKYAIHPTEWFKLVATALLFATPLIVGLGAVVFWRHWKPARSESAPSVVSR